MDWYPQAQLTGFHTCRRPFCGVEKTIWPFQKRSFVDRCCCFRDIWWLCILVKTSNRRGTQFQAEKWPNFVMGSHADPIGDLNDVRELLLLLNMLGCCLSSYFFFLLICIPTLSVSPLPPLCPSPPGSTGLRPWPNSVPAPPQAARWAAPSPTITFAEWICVYACCRILVICYAAWDS